MESRAANENSIKELIFDFDGTITGTPGSFVVKTPFYTSLTKDGKGYPGEIRPLAEIKDIVAAELSKNEPDGTRNLKRITEGACNALRFALKNYPRVGVTLCTRNKKEYLEALLQFEGFSAKEIADKINIVTRSSAESRLAMIDSKLTNPSTLVRFYDDEKENIEIVAKGLLTEIDTKRSTSLGKKYYRNDNRVILTRLYNHPEIIEQYIKLKQITKQEWEDDLGKDVQVQMRDEGWEKMNKEGWEVEIKELEKILSPEAKEEQKPVEVKDQKQEETSEKSKEEHEIEAELKEIELQNIEKEQNEIQKDKEKLTLKRSAFELKKSQHELKKSRLALEKSQRLEWRESIMIDNLKELYKKENEKEMKKAEAETKSQAEKATTKSQTEIKHETENNSEDKSQIPTITSLSPDYKKYDDDYLKTDEKTGAGMLMIRGKEKKYKQAPNQEDEHSVDILNDSILFLSPKEQESVFKQTIADMEKSHGNPLIGSTACVATAWIDEKNTLHATSTNLGDSLAYLVVVDDNEIISIQRLNKKLHNTTNKEECERFPGKIKTLLNGVKVIEQNGTTLQVTRAIGDGNILSREEDHIPDVAFADPINLKPGEKSFAVIASDGIEKVRLAEISKAIFENQNSPINAAHEIGKIGLPTKADNISIIVMPISKSIKPGAVSIKSGAAFDGHGRPDPVYGLGNNVSQGLNNDFYPQLNKNIQKTISQRVQQIGDLQKECVRYKKYLEKIVAVEPNPKNKKAKEKFDNAKESMGIMDNLLSKLHPEAGSNKFIYKSIVDTFATEFNKPDIQKKISALEEGKKWLRIVAGILTFGAYARHRAKEIGSNKFWLSREKVLRTKVDDILTPKIESPKNSKPK